MSVPLPRENPILIGISACLLGEKVRYDGGDAKNAYITGTLGKFVRFEPVCPEVAIGLTTPREPIHLAGNRARPRAVAVNNSRLDVTDKLEAYGRRQAGEHGAISGYIFKSGSPSCGLEVKVTGKRGHDSSNGVGVYARQIMERLEHLPVEEETGLIDPAARDNFIERVFAYSRWRKLAANRLTKARLVRFHKAHSLVLMAHSAELSQKLDRMAARAGAMGFKSFKEKYFALFMETMSLRATPARHAGVLRRLMDRVKAGLDRDDRAELHESIESYRAGRAPLIAPITLLKHHLRRNGDACVDNQVYLNHSPAELALRWGA